MTEPHHLSSWEPQTPSPDFPDRVLSALRDPTSLRGEGHAPRGWRRWPLLAVAVVAIGAVASTGVLVVTSGPTHGELTSLRRTEQPIGRRAVAVLEPQTHLRFDGGHVWQGSGRAFYRVNPGETFSVRTPVGTVEVHGTCFRVVIETVPLAPNQETPMPKSLPTIATSAAVGILATVIVYEGRLRLSHGSPNEGGAPTTLDLSAGERATLDSGGIRRVDGHDDVTSAAAAAPEVPKAADGSTDVAALRSKIAHVRRQKAALEGRLNEAQRELAKYEAAAGEQEKDEYKLSQDDWKELAKAGSLKFRTPCPVPPDWEPKAEVLDELGLATSDAEALASARRNSSRRLTEVVRPLCLAAVGNAAAVEAIDNLTCLHIVADVGHKTDELATSEAMRQVAEVNAGLIAGPTAEQLANPVFAGFYAFTNELPRFQEELTESFGPEQAKAIAFGKGFHVLRHSVGPR